MQAIQYSQRGPPSVLHLTELPVPTPGKGEVRIRVAYAGINPVDLHLRGEAHPLLKVQLPATPGKDASGVIDALGDGVHAFQKGDRVFVSDHTFRSGGTYAEYHVAKVEEVHALPEGYSFQEGAALGSPYFTALRAIFHAAHGKSGETMLVHGASGQVGLACVQIGVAHGIKVFGTAGTTEGLDRVLANKSTAVFNHREASYIDKIKDAVGVKGVDIIIEMSAGINLQHDIQLIGRRGRIVIVGTQGMISINPSAVLGKEVTITGVKLADSLPVEWETSTVFLREGLKNGSIRPVVGKEYPIAEAEKAHEDLEHSTGSQGRLVLKICGDTVSA